MNKIPYTLLVRLEAKPGKEEALKKILLYLIAETAKEEGCVHYYLHQSKNNPMEFMFYENWTDKEAHTKHGQTAHLHTWRAQRGELLAKDPEVTMWEMIG